MIYSWLSLFFYFSSNWTWYLISSWLFMIHVYMLQPPLIYSFRFVDWLCFLFFWFVVVAACLFSFPPLYLGNGSEQTNIVIYWAHWFIFVVSKLLFLGSIGVNTTKLDADKLDRPIYLGKVVWVIAVAPLAPYRELVIILVNMPFILSTTGESGIYFLEFGCRISYMAHESLTFR